MPFKYIFILLLTSFLWGGNFVYSKFLVNHASPMTLTLLRWLIAIMILLPIIKKKEKKLLPPKNSIFPLILMGVTGVVFFNIFQFLALSKTSSIKVGLISTLNPLSIAVASTIFLHEKILFRQLLAMLLSLIGVVIVLSKGKLDQLLSLHFNEGDLWMVAAVILWGVYSVCGNWAMQKVSPMIATFYSGVFGVIVLIPINFASFKVSEINASFIISLLYTGIVSTVVCMLLWNFAVQKVGAAQSGIFLNFNPLFTSILAFIILGETMSWSEIIGSMIVIAGCFLFSRYENQ